MNVYSYLLIKRLHVYIEWGDTSKTMWATIKTFTVVQMDTVLQHQQLCRHTCRVKEKFVSCYDP